jgi:hypothetical protein
MRCKVSIAVLCCAVLCCAVLCCAVLCCAVLCCAVLCCAVLCHTVSCGLLDHAPSGMHGHPMPDLHHISLLRVLHQLCHAVPA